MTKSHENDEPSRQTTRAEAQIEAHLKRVYDETANEALPDKLADLLSKLKAEEADDGE